MSNRRSEASQHFEIRYSLFDILRFKCTFLKHGLWKAKSATGVKPPPENVKLLLPPLQSRRARVYKTIGYRDAYERQAKRTGAFSR